MTNLTIANLVHFYAKELKDISSTPLLDVKICLAHILKISTAELYLKDDDKLDASQQKDLSSLMQRRINGEPVAYLIGKKDFWDFTASVDKSVLVPRPETEVLVEYILSFYRKECFKTVLDIGTGSGVIALSLARERDWSITAIDISLDALAIAKKNALKIGLEKKVKFYQSDLFQNVDGKFDIIASNPPYIADDDPHLGSLQHEPALALISPDQGYYHLYSIIDQAHNYLNQGGSIILEHGYLQGNLVRARFTERGYKDIQTVKDYAGLDRITIAFLP